MTSAAPYLPSLTTIDDGPCSMILRAPATTSRSPVKSSTSESLRITQSTSEIAATSASRAMFTQRSIESSATNFACSHWRRTLSCSAGKMFARNRTSQSLEACESFGIEVLEDVEVGLERVARVHVLVVDALPEERLAAGDVLDVVGDDVAAVQDGVLLVAEVVADRADDAHLVEERRGQREVRGGAAEHALAAAVRCLNRVERDRSNNSEAHGGRP